jgi:hypothetical protein
MKHPAIKKNFSNSVIYGRSTQRAVRLLYRGFGEQILCEPKEEEYSENPTY